MLGSSKSKDDTGRIATLADIEAFEAIPLRDRKLPPTTYAMLCAGAALAPDAPALSFFPLAADYARPFVWSHADLIRDVTRAANAFRRLGVERKDVVAFMLPNLPEAHFVIWGGEVAGIAFAINPLLEPDQIAELLRAGDAKWLVTLGPMPGVNIWEKARQAAASAPDLKGLLAVDILPYLTRSEIPACDCSVRSGPRPSRSQPERGRWSAKAATL